MRNFSKRLRQYIDDSGMTVEQFAKANKVSRTTIYNIFAGRKPSINFILSLIRYDPEIDLNWLLKESNYEQTFKTHLARESEDDYIELLRRGLEGLEKIAASAKPKKSGL